MVFEDLAGDGRGGDYDADFGAKAESEDGAVGLRESGEVGVEFWVEEWEAAEDWEAERAWWEWGVRGCGFEV